MMAPPASAVRTEEQEMLYLCFLESLETLYGSEAEHTLKAEALADYLAGNKDAFATLQRLDRQLRGQTPSSIADTVWRSLGHGEWCGMYTFLLFLQKNMDSCYAASRLNIHRFLRLQVEFLARYKYYYEQRWAEDLHRSIAAQRTV